MWSAFIAFSLAAIAAAQPQASVSPIIGILALPVAHNDCDTFHSLADAGATSCFHSLYVKWLEQTGARVVPLPYDLPRAEFHSLLSSLNGVLITGGSTNLLSLRSPYMEAAGRLYRYALQMHSKGEVWPLWGTCMGLQVLSVLGANSSSVLLSNAFDSEGLSLPLRLTTAASTSKLLCSTCLPSDTLKTLTATNSTVNLQYKICGLNLLLSALRSSPAD